MNLIYDRTAADVERALALAKKAEAGTLTDAEKTEWLAGMKGCYNAADMNRVEAAVKQLAAELNAAGYPAAVEPVLKGGSRLPSGYTQLEYIQSSGTQYIDTGASFSNGVRVETKFNLTSIATSSKKTPIFGAINASEPYGRDYLSVDSSKNFEIGGGAGYRYFKNNTIATNVDYEVEASNIPGQETLIVNGELYESTGGQAYATPFTDLPLYLFRVNTTNEAWFENASMKLYYAKFYDDKNVLVRNFTPCKNPSGEVGLYDYVTKAFYGNVGGGSLPDGYTELKYLQSSGTQYINTNFKPNGQSRIVMDCAPTSISSTFCFYCARSAASATVSDTNTLFFASNAYRGDYYGQSASTSGHYGANTRIVIDNNKGNIKIGNYSISNSPVSTSSPMPWILMASAKNSGSAVDTSSLGNYASMKLYSCKIYNNGTLVRDFIPAKNSSGTIGLYDIVNGAFYANAGSGTFTAGADIVGFTAGAEIGALEDREWRESDIVRLSQWTTYLDNVQKLRDAYYTLAETGALPKPEDKLGYVGANTVEKILADIDLLIGWMKSSYRRCGTFQSGNNAAHLPLKGSA